MRKYLLAAVAAAAISTPALATNDHAGYVGIEGGLLIPRSQSVQGDVVFTGTGATNFARTNVGTLRYKKGLDLDFVGGYDFGMFRLEGELGYKHAKARSFTFRDSGLVSAINTGAGTTLTTASDFGLGNSASVYSAMVNALIDFGGNGGIGGYAGAGAGYADVKQFGNSQGKFAWQLIAGVYAPISRNIDIGLKYRYFHAGANNGTHSYAFTPTSGALCGPTGATFTCLPGTATFYNDSKFTSHSLLASLVYNFGATAAPVVEAPPPPPPPPPAAPATQTCPDGSVILATSTCPAPPPPPPPPPPAPVERGERGR